MSTTYPPSAALMAKAHVDAARYDAMYAQSVSDPDGFWAEQAQRLDWMKAPSEIKTTDFTLGQVSIEWFRDGTLNVAANCIDRHLETRGDQTAIIFEPDDPDEAGAARSPIVTCTRNVCKHGQRVGNTWAFERETG